METYSLELMKSLKTSHLDQNSLSDYNFQTELLTNDYRRGLKVLTQFRKQLALCDEFLFSVAFITEGGLSVIANQLKATENKNVRGKIITSSYLAFNEPKVYRKLLSYPNIEVRVFEQKPLHSKGYIFKHGNLFNFILGSSNLTQNALTQNNEWNIKLSSLESGKIINDAIDEFNKDWEESIVLSEEWIRNYEINYTKLETITVSKSKPIMPNKMQTEALRNLEKLRHEGQDKALLVSSTGTGKTYLSAFDVRNAHPNRCLFIVHREQIAKDALESFKRIMPDKTYGLISGNIKDTDKDYIFTTVQSLSRDYILNSFSKNHFDYIIIDEAHHSGAKSYLKIIDYFKPQFLLGMTATPERTDNYDIFRLFDYNIAYEIRLQDALEEDMLCPFHYFGINDISAGDSVITDLSEFNLLIAEERVNHIVEKTQYYGYSGEKLSGLIFVSRNEEALELERRLNKKGLRTLALSGKSSQFEREMAIDRLTRINGDIDYIITVDIFNEGIDIPEVNQIVMLRPTQSAIIFVQQLGRGLRKQNNKDYVVVLDFIGNYDNNFFIPIALSGDKTYNKNTIKEFLIEGTATLPGCSTIDFDEISKERIYQSINKQNFSKMKHLQEQYHQLKNKIGKIPKLSDFINYNSIDPQVIFQHKDFSNYSLFLSRVEKESHTALSKYENQFLTFITLEFPNGMRLHEINLIEALLNNESKISNEMFIDICSNKDIERSLKRIFTLEFFVKTDFIKYGSSRIIDFSEESLSFNSKIKQSIRNNPVFKEHIVQVIELAKLNNRNKYQNTLPSSNMVPFEKYTKKDMCRLFNWDNDEKGTIYGYRFKHDTFPIYVTYHKDEDISDSIKYKDQFINPQIFSWMTKNNRTLESKEVHELKQSKVDGTPTQLFIKKEDGEKSQFYYMGEMFPFDYQEELIKTNKGNLPVVNIKFELEEPVRSDLYDFIVNN